MFLKCLSPLSVSKFLVKLRWPKIKSFYDTVFNVTTFKVLLATFFDFRKFLATF